MALAAAFATAAVHAQTSGAESPPAATSSTSLPPIKARVKAGDRVREITLVGLNDENVLYVDSSTGGRRLMLAIEKIETVQFPLEYNEFAVYRAVWKRDWLTAIQEMLPAIKPTLPYLALPNNNAARPAIELGNHMMRAAEKAAYDIDTEGHEETAAERYEAAYAVLQEARAADWYSGGTVAYLKSIQCLLNLERPKSAAAHFERVTEPVPGDVAYGLYFLTKAQLAVDRGDFRGAMDATVKSLCFENKDVDTFPDALLVSAQCYEELQEWHRARDVYYEVARVFPSTDWSGRARQRLSFIMEKRLTLGDEKTPIESVFFGWTEDMNEEVKKLLESAEAGAEGEDEEEEEDIENLDREQAPAAGEEDIENLDD